MSNQREHHGKYACWSCPNYIIRPTDFHVAFCIAPETNADEEEVRVLSHYGHHCRVRKVNELDNRAWWSCWANGMHNWGHITEKGERVLLQYWFAEQYHAPRVPCPLGGRP